MAKKKFKERLQEVSEEKKEVSNNSEESIFIPEETRGRKPKEITLEDVTNKAKELILEINRYIVVKSANGKNCNRLRSASSDIQRMLRTHLID